MSKLSPHVLIAGRPRESNPGPSVNWEYRLRTPCCSNTGEESSAVCLNVRSHVQCRSSVTRFELVDLLFLDMFDCISIVALWSECDDIVALSMIKAAHPCPKVIYSRMK